MTAGPVWGRYDDVAATYDAVAVPHYFAAPAERLIAFAELRAGQLLLDAGSGTGAIASAALRSAPRVRAVACDLSRVMLRYGREHGIRRSTAASVLMLPFLSHTFDCVTAGFVLNHMTDCRAAVREMSRVAKPAARIAVTSWAIGPSENDAGRAWRAVAERFVPPDQLRAASLDALPSEEPLTAVEALRAAVQSVVPHIAVAQTVAFPVSMPTRAYLEARHAGMPGRFMRNTLGPAHWSRFVRESEAALRGSFGDAVQFTVSVNFVVARR